MSLCPVFDFANHVWTRPTMKPVRAAESEIWQVEGRSPGGGGNSDLVFASCDTGVTRDQEVTLRYGWHPNRTLFVEYGFTNAITSEEVMSGMYPGEVNIQDIVTSLLDRQGETGAFVKRTLEREGYWGNWTMHCSPQPAHASFRLITALRLYHSFTSSKVRSEEEMKAASRRWQDTIMGHKEIVSEENEKACNKTISEICEMVMKRAKSGIKAVKEERSHSHSHSHSYSYSLSLLSLLWSEELWVSEAVAMNYYVI
ncbi:hypothetical protein B0F90DRAFT_777523 [Multifurca ochricompacta]|uniref:SET domain-containing protein n=1 Tax=Multifurca ochricompacta TaxID=376703 RepID=A0AAD4MCD4_9AGAM|nr:hypothetical protein B0F90DRAFT_777523 [Multifurca ochricompacta]